MRILVGYDGSECSNGAIDSLAYAGLPPRGEAVVLTVADVWPGALDTGIETMDEQELVRIQELKADEVKKLPAVLRRAYEQAEEELEKARETAARGAQRLRRLFPGWNLEAKGVADPPSPGVLRQADSWNSDLVVMGSHGRSGLKRFFMGSVSHYLVSHSARSVHVGRPGERERTPGPPRVAVGVDGSEDSERAVREIAGRHWPEGTQVHVVAALDPRLLTMPLVAGYPSWGLGGISSGEERHWYEQMVDGAASELGAAGLRVTTAVREGDPKWALVKEAEDWNADCLFVGARGHGMLERMLVGSVSLAVAIRAHCSVEVIRPQKGSESP